VIEQQMMTFNPRCSIIEAQLHAFLYPRARSISPRSVAAYFQLTREALKGVGGDSNNSGLKKRISSLLVERMLRSDETIISSTPEFLTMVQSSPKRDDLSDAVLNGLMHTIQQRRLIHEALQLLELQVFDNH
jgi:hypothetical protein